MRHCFGVMMHGLIPLILAIHSSRHRDIPPASDSNNGER